MVKHKSNKKRKENKGNKETTNPIEGKKKNKFSLPRQLLVLLCSFIFISVLLNENKGYNWVIKTLLKNNLEVIKKYEDISIEEKYRAKFGYNYTYLNYLVNNTPEDAIIIVPPKDVVFPKGQKSNFQNKNPYLLARKPSTSYFTYPRKLVYETEKDTSELYSKATHVAIINGWGYDKLNYEVNNKVDNTIMPINQPQVQ